MAFYEQLGIFCDDHPNDNAEFFCKDHNILVCNKCIITTHKNHNNIPISKELINNYNKNLLDFLNIEFERIKSLIMEIHSYVNNERQLTTTQYMKLIEEAQDTLLPILKTQEEKDSIKFLSNDLPNEPINAVQAQIEEQKFDVDSVLITQLDQYQFIKDSIRHQYLKLELLFRGSRDGFEAAQFHNRCDDKGATLTVIKSEHNRLFGGYTNISWKSTEDRQSNGDDNAFIFSLTDKRKFTQYQNQEKAVYFDKVIGPTFGFGGDIYISDKCNQNSNSRSNNGGTYNLPKGNDNSDEYAKQYLAGSHKFKVIDYEVFQVNIQ